MNAYHLLLLLVVSLPNIWLGWRFSREIKTSGVGLATFVCPREAYDHGGVRLEDVRMIDSKAEAIPFVLQKQPPNSELQWRAAKMLADNSKGGVVEVTFDSGEVHRYHNMMRLEIPDQDFLSRVEIAVSDLPDRDWHVLRSGIPIYRFMPDGLEGNQTILYPNSEARYIQVKITPQLPDGATEALNLENATMVKVLDAKVAYDDSKKPDWLAYSPIFSPDLSTSNLQTWWRSDALTDTLPITGVRFNVINKEFHRALKISASPDKKNWTVVATSHIFRSTGDRPFERVVVEVVETSMRYWRVQCYDNGSPPLTISKIELLGVPYHVVFQSTGKKSYRVLYGNGKVAGPDYELSRTISRTAYQSAAEAVVGDEEDLVFNDHSLWFWVAVGGGVIAVAVIAVVVFSLLSEDSESHQEPV